MYSEVHPNHVLYTFVTLLAHNVPPSGYPTITVNLTVFQTHYQLVDHPLRVQQHTEVSTRSQKGQHVVDLGCSDPDAHFFNVINFNNVTTPQYYPLSGAGHVQVRMRKLCPKDT